jgi:hypothetical protein
MQADAFGLTLEPFGPPTHPQKLRWVGHSIHEFGSIDEPG